MALLRALAVVLALLVPAVCSGTASASGLEGWSCQLELTHFSYYSAFPSTGTAQCLRGVDTQNARTATATLTIAEWDIDSDVPGCDNGAAWHASGQLQLSVPPSWYVSEPITLDGHVGDAEATLQLANGARGAITIHADTGYLNWCLKHNNDGTSASGAFVTPSPQSGGAACVLNAVRFRRQPDRAGELESETGRFYSNASVANGDQTAQCTFGDSLPGAADFSWNGTYADAFCEGAQMTGTMSIARPGHQSVVSTYTISSGPETAVLHAGGWRGLLHLEPIDTTPLIHIGGDPPGCMQYYQLSGLLLSTST